MNGGSNLWRAVFIILLVATITLLVVTVFQYKIMGERCDKIFQEFKDKGNICELCKIFPSFNASAHEIPCSEQP